MKQIMKYAVSAYFISINVPSNDFLDMYSTHVRIRILFEKARNSFFVIKSLHFLSVFLITSLSFDDPSDRSHSTCKIGL